MFYALCASVENSCSSVIMFCSSLEHTMHFLCVPGLSYYCKSIRAQRYMPVTVYCQTSLYHWICLFQKKNDAPLSGPPASYIKYIWSHFPMKNNSAIKASNFSSRAHCMCTTFLELNFYFVAALNVAKRQTIILKNASIALYQNINKLHILCAVGL